MNINNMKLGRVSALSVIDLARELVRRDLLTDAELKAISSELPTRVAELVAGQDMSELTSFHYPEAYLIALWNLAAAANNTELLGLEIGQTITPQAHGVLANWIRHCKTLQEGLQTYIENIALLNQSEQWQLLQHEDSSSEQALVELNFKFDHNKEYPLIAWQRSLIVIPVWGEYFSGSTVQLERLELPFSEPTKPIHDAWESAFKCPVLFNQSKCSLWFKRSVLAKPSIFADQFVKSLVSEKAQSLLPKSKLDIKQHVLAIIQQDPFANSSLDIVAKAMSMSRSTLYRKLKEADLSFSELLEQYRYQIWRNNQNALNEKSAEALCEQMGFSDPSSLYKLQKRWLQNKQ